METNNSNIEIDKSNFDLDDMIKFRKWMHQNPELSLKEFKTIAKIKEKLLSLGVKEECMQEMADTGLILDLQGTGPAKGSPFKVALRSDHDGLPIQEENPHLPYMSQNEGCGHMCGHDGHTTCLISAVALIINNLDKIPSNKSFRAIFQPGEEGFRGAQKMVDAGCLEGVNEIYGLHNRPKLDDKGIKVIVSDGLMHSHCNFFFIEVKKNKILIFLDHW